MSFITSVSNMLLDWPMGSLLGVLTVVISLILVGLIAFCIFYVVDTWFCTRLHGVGRITDKNFVPAHTTTTLMFNAATKTTMPVVSYIPDAWNVKVMVDGQEDDVQIDKSIYNSVSRGESVNVEYIIGRLSSSLNIKAIRNYWLIFHVAKQQMKNLS